jgi:hypothetical protein
MTRRREHDYLNRNRYGRKNLSDHLSAHPRPGGRLDRAHRHASLAVHREWQLGRGENRHVLHGKMGNDALISHQLEQLEGGA